MGSNGKIHAQVAVVGAGPAGTTTALKLAQLGIDDVVLLDAHDFPRDKTCGSGLSPRCISLLRELGVWQQVESLAYTIEGLRLVTPGGRDVYLSGGPSQQAAICLRRDLDHSMLKSALELGVRFEPNFKAHTPLMSGERWTGIRASDGREVHADFTVVANGAHSKFAIESDEPRRYIHAIMGWWENVQFRPHYVEMIWDKMISPYYGWLFPESATRVNIGITYEDDSKVINARRLFKKFLDKHYGERLAEATQLGAFKGHPILYSYKIGKLGSPGRVVVGEAGRMTHPATGEGIYHGMHSGCLAAEALRDVIRDGQSEIDAVERYQKRCARAFVPGFWAGGAFREIVRTPLLDWAASFSARPRVKSTIAQVLARM